MLIQSSQYAPLEGHESASSLAEVAERLIGEVQQSQTASENIKDLMPKLE
jgi:hypothetical protein